MPHFLRLTHVGRFQVCISRPPEYARHVLALELGLTDTRLDCGRCGGTLLGKPYCRYHLSHLGRNKWIHFIHTHKETITETSDYIRKKEYEVLTENLKFGFYEKIAYNLLLQWECASLEFETTNYLLRNSFQGWQTCSH